ncbi:MAG: HDOD domain-containing protein [Planctomycetota bacterium]|jgi:HD-like signal output (HDOD) protein
MGFLKKIRRHAAIATGNFAAMFKDVEIPPLPEAVTRLIQEINHPEPDIDRLAELISSTAGVAAKVIQTVNSALFSLRMPVTNVKHAVSLLGVQQIRSITLACATMEALPKPKSAFFDPEAFWTDSLLQAMLSRSFAKKLFQNQSEDVFTASLLTDVALPVLLCVWSEYYEPVIKEWRQSSRRLSEIEREHFGWDHAQAGAWISQAWGFPEEMVCYLAAHNLSREKINELELADTIVSAIAVAAFSPSVLKPDQKPCESVFHGASQWLSLSDSTFVDCVIEVKKSLTEMMEVFGLTDRNATRILEDLLIVADSENHEEEA